MEMTKINGQVFIVKGIAKYLAETGLPLSEMQKYAKSQDVEISWLNVCDEMKRSGSSKKRILSEMNELNHFHPQTCDINLIERFLDADYTDSRAILHEWWSSRGDVMGNLMSEVQVSQQKVTALLDDLSPIQEK